MKNNFFRKVSLLSLALLAVSSCGDKPANVNYINGTYNNPVFVTNSSGSYYSAEIADPCVVRDENGEFWAFATCRRVLHSVDGCEWEKWSDAIIKKPTWGDAHFKAAGKSGAELWAPDVVKIGDKWIYYSQFLISVIQLALAMLPQIISVDHIQTKADYSGVKKLEKQIALAFGLQSTNKSSLVMMAIFTWS